MNIVVYHRTRPAEPDASAAALLLQQKAVTAWLSDNAATHVATFTEAESDATRRPQLGAALKACREHDALLLVAMTNAIGMGPPFVPVGHRIGDVRYHALTHPEAHPVPDATKPVPVVIYYRVRPGEPEESARVLVAQQKGVAAWLARNEASVVASFTEEEGTGPDRPALAASVRACRVAGATLLVASLDAIGSGLEPSINIASVPVAVAPTEVSAPEILPLPASSPQGLFLYLRPSRSGRLPVYLCNPGPAALAGIVLRTSGVTGKLGPKVSVTASGQRTLDTLEPGICRLVDSYDRDTDGDRLTAYALTFTDADGVRRSAGVILSPDDPSDGCFPLKRDPEPGGSTMRTPAP